MELPAPSQQDLAEASVVTAQQSGHQFEIQLGHLCNNRCVFCVSGHVSEMRMAKPLAVQPILDTITEARENGAERIVFLGGEPTLQRGFIPALKHAHELGFSEIVVFTNGVRLPTKGFLDECLAIGDFTWRISIQGANEEAHVAVTKKPNSFKRIIKGIAMLQERGQRVTANMCVCEESYRSLPDYPEMVETYDIKQLHIDIVRPASSGIKTEAYLRAIMPQYSVMAPYYAEMLEGFEQTNPDFDINVGNLPICVLPEWGHKIHHAGENTITRSAALEGLEEEAVDKYAVHKSQRRHLPGCRDCAFLPRCTGVFHDYLSIYGDEEFKPVSVEALRSLDPAQNNFTVLVEPFIDPLIESDDAPDGWRVKEYFADARSRRVELRFVSPKGAATLYVGPPEGVGQEVNMPPSFFATDQYRCAIAVEGWFPEEHLVTLVEWVVEKCSGANDIATTTAPLNLDVVRNARGEDPAFLRSRARMMRMVRSLQQHRRFNGWRYGGTRPRPDGRGVTVDILGPEGFQLHLHIDIGVADGKSTVQATFDLGEGTEPSVARPAVEAISGVLRRAEQRRRA